MWFDTVWFTDEEDVEVDEEREAREDEDWEEEDEIELLQSACEKGIISTSDWNDGNYDITEILERMR